MSAPPRPSPVELFALLVRGLLMAVGVYQVGRIPEGQVPGHVAVLVNQRLRRIQERFVRLVASILAGSFTPPRFTPRGTRPTPAPREPSPFRRFGWLDAMLPPAVAQQQRAHLFHLLQQPETAALIQAAPAQMARLLRPMCWMLKLRPPPVLAASRRPAGTPPPAPAPYVAPPPPPPPLPGPANTLGLHPIQLGLMRPPPKIA